MATHHEGLIYIMVMAAAADREMKDSEMMRLGDIVRSLPVFADFDENDIPSAGHCLRNPVRTCRGAQGAEQIDSVGGTP